MEAGAPRTLAKLRLAASALGLIGGAGEDAMDRISGVVWPPAPATVSSRAIGWRGAGRTGGKPRPKRYKGSNIAKRATRRGGNHAAY